MCQSNVKLDMQFLTFNVFDINESSVLLHVRTGYKSLPEMVISIAGIAEPDYKMSAACVSSPECAYNEVLSESRYFICSVFVKHCLCCVFGCIECMRY